MPSAEMRANPAGRRAATALLTLSLRGIGVRSSVLRFPPTVHGDGDHGFVATLVDIARRRGVAGYVGDGTNRWPAVHRSDAARLARLAVEAAPAGSVLHAVADEGVPFREIAGAMGRHLGVPTASVAPADAVEHFAHLGHFVAVDSPATAAVTRELLAWEPTGPQPARGPRAGPLLPPGVNSDGGSWPAGRIACRDRGTLHCPLRLPCSVLPEPRGCVAEVNHPTFEPPYVQQLESEPHTVR